MKQIASAIQMLKLIAKYGAYFIVIFDIISYAVDKLQTVADKIEAEQNNDGK